MIIFVLPWGCVQILNRINQLKISEYRCTENWLLPFFIKYTVVYKS